MSVAGVSGLAVGAAAGGIVLVWSGLTGAKVSATLSSLVAGQKPAGQGAVPITASYDAATQSSASSSGGAVAASSAPGASSYNTAGLEALWQQAGGSAASAPNAACHAMQESSGQAAVTSANPDGGINVGLWQLDTKGEGAGYTVAQLQNPLTNARITVMKTGNGANWSAWATPGC